MSTAELVKIIDTLPAEKQKAVEDFVADLIEQLNPEPQKTSNFEIKVGFGGGKGIFGKMADDFDEPLDEMKDYRVILKL